MLLLLSVTGCEEFVNPKVDVKSIPVLYCIISTLAENSRAMPEVVLTRVYHVEGLDPSANRTDPAIDSADVTLSFRGVSYRMKEASMRRTDTSRYSTKQSFYWVDLPSVNPGDTLSVFVRTPQGEVLTAGTSIPQGQSIKTSIEFPAGFTTLVNKFNVGSSWTLTWTEGEDHIFFPKLRVWYRKYTDTVRIIYSQEIPLSYVRRNGVGVPVYASYQWSNSASYELSSFDSAMAQISAGDPNKHQYKIDYMIFSLTECDRSLSRYYSSVRGYLDDYSVRLDESIYTNVSGGIGVFGSSRTTSVNYPVDLGYIRSFGYQ
jgi:hypothetical protein